MPRMPTTQPKNIKSQMKCPQCSSQSVLDQELDPLALAALYQEISLTVNRLLPTSQIQLYRCRCCSLGFFSPPIAGDEEFYNALALKDWYYSHTGKSEYALAAKLIKSGDRVVDVGAGIGEFQKYVPSSASFLGIELSPRAVEIAKGLGRNVCQMDINDSRHELETRFDVVTCFQVLEHLQKPNLLVTSLIKLCKPNGLIVIAVPNNKSFLSKALNNALNLPPHHLLHWNKQSLFQLATQNNLHVESYIEEQLQDVHRIAYYCSIINSFLLNISGRNHKLVDYPVKNKFLSRQIGRLSKLLAITLPNPVATGHTAIIVLRKAHG